MNEFIIVHSYKKGNDTMNQQPKPHKVHVQVDEPGKKAVDIRLPYGMFRLGMKYGASAAKGEQDACARAMANLVDFDCATFERSVANGEISLPRVLLDTMEAASNTHVVITAE